MKMVDTDRIARQIITLCGSTKFKDLYLKYNRELTLAGNVVFSCGLFGHADKIELTEKQKDVLDHVHFCKIHLSDEIFVINPDGYIGASTRNEIEFAKSLSKKITYLEKSE